MHARARTSMDASIVAPVAGRGHGVKAPSSAPSGHLLPKGRRDPWRASVNYRARTPLSPSGRGREAMTCGRGNLATRGCALDGAAASHLAELVRGDFLGKATCV